MYISPASLLRRLPLRRGWRKSCCALALAIAALTAFMPVGVTAQILNNEAVDTSQMRNYVSRIVLPVRQSRDVVFDLPVISVIVIDPTFVTAELKSERVITFAGVAAGETMIIVVSKERRVSYAVEVREQPVVTGEQIAANVARRQRELLRPAGSLFFTFSPAFGGGTSSLRQGFDYRRSLGNDRTLRIESDVFKLFGSKQGSAYAAATHFGINRVMLGMSSPQGELDLLDSELNITPLSFSGYTMRGVHLASALSSRWRGLEFFAGLARPSLTLFDHKKGLLAGAVIPVLQGPSWRVRAGVMAIRVQHNEGVTKTSGVVWQTDARYAPPGERMVVESEMAYGSGGLSWRARLDLRNGPFTIYGESLSFNRNSPLVGIGAQSGGRKLKAFAIGWQPSAQFDARFSFSRAANALTARSQRVGFNHSNIFASLNYNLNPASRFGLRFNQQEIETATAGASSFLRLETRNAAVTHNLRFAGDWANDLEVSLTSSREQGAGAQLERGLSVRDELRRSIGRWSGTAYVNYTRNTPSLASLIVRSPQLLPPVLRRAYEHDPARFLIENSATLASLLPGVELPQTRSFDLGFRLQGAFSRYNWTSEMRYSAGEILARQTRRLSTTLNLGIRLDAANSLQVGGSRSLILNAPGSNTPGSQATFTVSYIHRFGTGGGDGFQFSKLFGLDRGNVQGRAFFDQNGNGEDDLGEPGVAGMKVQLDHDHSVTTDEHGQFRFTSVTPGEYNVVLTSNDLGVRLRASTTTEHHVFLSPRQTIKISYGLTNFGSVGGQIFNDLSHGGEKTKKNAPGVAGVRISLRSLKSNTSEFSQTVDASGAYSFRNLAPGSYTLEIDPVTVPPDFRLPREPSWNVVVEPLQAFYLDIALAAQRAVSGVVFVDKDGDGKFDSQKDEAVEGARVITGRTEVTTGRDGAYILRGLPAGRIELRAILPRLGAESRVITVELGPEPITRRGVHIAVAQKKTAEEGK